MAESPPPSEPAVPTPQPLDEEHVLEPVEDPDGSIDDDPVVSDVRGRLWRIRRPGPRSDYLGWAAVALAALVLAVLAVWLIS